MYLAETAIRHADAQQQGSGHRGLLFQEHNGQKRQAGAEHECAVLAHRMCEVVKLMLTEQQKGKQTRGCRTAEEVNGEAEADDRSDGEECGDRSAKLHDGLQVIGNMQHGLQQFRREGRQQRTMKIPVPLDYLAGPDLFFRVIKRRKSVSVGKPEKAHEEHRQH